MAGRKLHLDLPLGEGHSILDLSGVHTALRVLIAAGQIARG